MRIIVQQVGRTVSMTDIRTIAEWVLPDVDEAMELSFTQLATPDTLKVATFRIIIVNEKAK